MFALFCRFPVYRQITELMERRWNDGTIMEIYQ